MLAQKVNVGLDQLGHLLRVGRVVEEDVIGANPLHKDVVLARAIGVLEEVGDLVRGRRHGDGRVGAGAALDVGVVGRSAAGGYVEQLEAEILAGDLVPLRAVARLR